MPARPPKPPLAIERGRGERESGRGLVPTDGALDTPYNSYLEEIAQSGSESGQKEFQFALALSSDARFREFLRQLEKQSNHGKRRTALATIAKQCDISLPQFAEFWQSAQRAIAMARAQSAIPSLISDMTVDAASRMITCSRCDGFGTVADYADKDKVSKLEGASVPDKIKPCPNCKGTGEVREVGNQHARDKLLEVTGMVKKGGGAAVQITQNFGGATMESAVSGLNSITFDAPIIDVEPG